MGVRFSVQFWTRPRKTKHFIKIRKCQSMQDRRSVVKVTNKQQKKVKVVFVENSSTRMLVLRV